MRLSFGIRLKCSSTKLRQLLIESCFGFIPPAFIDDAIAGRLHFYNIIHLALVLKFSAVFPAEKALDFCF